MPTSTDALTQLGGSASGLLGIANLISSLAPIFLGTGTTTSKDTGQTGTSSASNVAGLTNTAGTSNVAGTTAGQQFTTTGAAPNIIQSMIDQMNNSLKNAADPSQIQPIIDNIIQQAKLAFAPTLSSLPTSGIYNSTSLGLLAGNASAQAVAQSASTVLNYIGQQQTLASNIGSSLLGATKTTDTTTGQQQQTGTTAGQQQQTGTTTNAQQQQTTASTGTKSTSPTVPFGASSALLGALGLPFLTDKLGITNIGGFLKNLFPSSDPTGANILGPGNPVYNVEQLLGESPSDIAASQAAGGTAPAVSSFVSGGLPTGSLPAGLASDPAVGALAALAPPGTIASNAELGNVQALGLNPNAPSLIDPFVTLPGGAGTGISGGAAPIGADVAGGAQGGDASLNFASSEALGGGGGGGIGDFFSNIGSNIGSAITGAQGTVQGAATSLFGNDVGSFLTTPAPGLGTIASDVGNVFSSGFSSDALSTAAGDIGSGLASAGAGIGGGLLAGAIRPGENKIGGDIGGTIGGVAGSLFGPIGSFAGSFLGNLVGGLFGQTHPENSYFYLPTSVSNGQLTYGNPTAQNYHGQEYNTMVGYQQQLNSFNSLLSGAGLKASISTPFYLGQANPNANDAVKTYSNIGDAFSNFNFSSDNPTINSAVSGKTFSNPNDLLSAVQNASAAPAASSAQQPAQPAAQPQAAAATAPITGVSAAPTATNPATGTTIIDPYQVLNLIAQTFGGSAGNISSGGDTSGAASAASSGGTG